MLSSACRYRLGVTPLVMAQLGMTPFGVTPFGIRHRFGMVAA